MWWTVLRTYGVRLLAHIPPDTQRCGVHVEQSNLLSAVASQTVDAESGQQARLPGSDQIWAHAHRWSILNLLHLVGALRNYRIVHGFWRAL